MDFMKNCIKLSALFLCALIFSVLSESSYANKPLAEEKSSLLAAWEEMQKQNPNVEVFEKINDKSYKYKHSQLRFEGILEIISLDIISMGLDEVDEFEGIKSGTVDVYLDGFDENQRQLFRAFNKWQTNNTLYFIPKENRWLDWSEYSDILEKNYRHQSAGDGVAGWFADKWIYIFAIIMCYFVIETYLNRRKVSHSLNQQKMAIEQQLYAIKLQEEGIEVTKETNQYLKQLLKQLKIR